MNAYTLLEIERYEALASELHPDHWPPWLAQLARCIEVGDPWWVEADGSRHTSGLAVALVGAPVKAGPRARRSWGEHAHRCAGLRAAIVAAGGAKGTITSVGRYAADCILVVDSDEFGSLFIVEGDLVAENKSTGIATRNDVRRREVRDAMRLTHT